MESGKVLNLYKIFSVLSKIFPVTVSQVVVGTYDLISPAQSLHLVSTNHQQEKEEDEKEEEEVEVVDSPEEVKEEKKDLVDYWCLLESMEDFCSYEVDKLELFKEVKEVNIIVSILTLSCFNFYVLH